LTVLPWTDALATIEDAARRGPAPDIVQLGTTWVASIAATGALFDLTGRYDERIFPSAVLSTTTIEGLPGRKPTRFAMPWFIDTRAIYYNKAACARAGVNPATDFATWNSFRIALQKLKGIELDGKRLLPLGFPDNAHNTIHSLSWLIWGAGGGFVARGNKEPGINSPATITGLEYAAGLVRDGLMVPLRDDDGSKEEDLKAMLRDGNASSILSYPLPSLPDDRFGVAPLPRGPRGRFTFLGGSALAIFKSSPHPAEAMALLRFLASEGAQLNYSAITGFLPAAAKQYDDLLLSLDPIRSVLVKQLQYGRAYPSIPQWAAIEEVLHEGFGVVWRTATQSAGYDRVDVRRELDKLAKQIDGAMAVPGSSRRD
jgi:multiple sugar transport system substrate-binding protein